MCVVVYYVLWCVCFVNRMFVCYVVLLCFLCFDLFDCCFCVRLRFCVSVFDVWFVVSFPFWFIDLVFVS